MSWRKGHRRSTVGVCGDFVAGLVCESGLTTGRLATACGLDRGTLARWISGRAAPTQELLEVVIDRVLPLGRHGLPVYRSDMALDGRSRVGGVSEYTLRAGAGDACSGTDEEEER
jgi:hypothetical protein